MAEIRDDAEARGETAAGARGEVRFISFSLAGERYALPLLAVREVVAMASLTPLPLAPRHVRGILNLRGKMVAVADPRVRLGMRDVPDGPETAIIVLNAPPLSVGIVVDCVESVVAVDASAVRPPPIADVREGVGYIRGVINVDKKMILVMDAVAAIGLQGSEHEQLDI